MEKLLLRLVRPSVKRVLQIWNNEAKVVDVPRD